MRVTYHPDASAELRQAAWYYEERSPGLGIRFLHAYDEAIAEISQWPRLWPVVEDDIRRHVVSRFPYGIYYRVQDDEIYILVVMHHSRHPDYWRDRL